MAKVYEDTKGNTFSTQREAALSNTSLGTNPRTQNAPITTSAITPKAPLVLPTPTQPSYGNIESNINGAVSAQKSASQMAADQAKVSSDSSLSEYMKALTDSGNISSSVDRTKQDEARKKSDLYTSQIEQEALALRRKVQSIEKNTQGLFGGALQDEVNRVSRESLSKQADLAILQSAANRDYDTAASIADRSVALKMEQSKANLDALRFFYENNKSNFDKQDQRAYGEKIQEEERAYNKAEKEATTVTNLGLQVATNQAPAAIASKALASKSVAELMAIPGIGKYLQSPLERLQLQKAGLDIKKATMELKDIMGTTGVTNLTESQRQDILKNPVAVKAASRIGVIKALEEYKNIFAEYQKQGEPRALRDKLNGMLNTTIGSAINVAQGQGAMGEEEGKRILGDLKITSFGNIARRVPATANGVIASQNTLYENDVNFVDSAIPGARYGYQLFADYEKSKTDPLLITNSQYGENRLNL